MPLRKGLREVPDLRGNPLMVSRGLDVCMALKAPVVGSLLNDLSMVLLVGRLYVCLRKKICFLGRLNDALLLGLSSSSGSMGSGVGCSCLLLILLVILYNFPWWLWRWMGCLGLSCIKFIASYLINYYLSEGQEKTEMIALV